MNSKSDTQQNVIVSEIKKVEKSLRTELKKTERILRDEILRAEQRVEIVEEKLIKKISETKDDLMGKIDNFAGRVVTLEDENEVGADHARELRVEVDDHEKRITRLESPTSS